MVAHASTRDYTICILLQLLDCDYAELVGNGHCNDEANNANCVYDGGDCCGACAKTDQCLDCVCHDGEPAGVGCNYIFCYCQIPNAIRKCLIHQYPKSLYIKFMQSHTLFSYSWPSCSFNFYLLSLLV